MSERDDGFLEGLHYAHALTAHMLDCPGAKKTDIVSQTPEYKIGYVEALVNAMGAIEVAMKNPANTHSHDHHHLQSQTESQSHDQQSATASPVEPTGQS